jgi:two-component system, NarL family, response regulator DegU
MKLLIVEDNFKVRQLMKSIFKLEFNDIKECQDGSDVLDEYTNFKPDWVFMDIEMKKLDGITASKELLSSFPDAKIIIVTNHDNKEYKKDAKSAGVREYILKENLSDIFDIIKFEAKK